MSGEAPRLKLLWARGYCSFQEWADANPDLNFILRRALQVASSWTHFWFISKVFCMPWLLAGLADHRRSQSELRSLRTQIWGLDEEMNDDWFGIVFLSLAGSLELLESDEVISSILQWAHEVIGTVAPIEFMHGRNHRRVDQSMSWANFVGKSLNIEALDRHKWQQAALYGGLGSSTLKRHMPSSDGKPRRTRAKSTYDIVRGEEIESRTSMGYTCNVTGSEFISTVKERMCDSCNKVAAMCLFQTVPRNLE
jgi:hypothetical protein